MRLIDADAYAAEMKKRQDACERIMNRPLNDVLYTDRQHWEGVMAVFAEAKLTLDEMPTIKPAVTYCPNCGAYVEVGK